LPPVIFPQKALFSVIFRKKGGKTKKKAKKGKFLKIDFAKYSQKRQKNYKNELLETPVKIFICFADI